MAIPIDLMTLSVIQNRLVIIPREMGQVIMRCSQNYPSSQLFDFSTGIFDSKGELLAQGASLPGNSLTGRGQVQCVIEKFGDEIYPGDEFFMNDPFVGAGTHLPCWGFVRPIFQGGELLFYTHTKQHQMDTSGSFPGGYFPNAYDIHAEGLCIPPIKYRERGKPVQGVHDFLYNNVRYRDDVKIDNESMFAAHRIGADKVERLLERYGKETLLAYVEALKDRMERFVRSEIEKIPDGIYYGEAACDDDGTKYEVPVVVRVKVTVQGSNITLDFSESDKQVNFINSPWENTIARAITAVFYSLDPSMARYHNEGSCRPIEVISPPGTCVRPVYPATVGACPIYVANQIRDAIFQALGQACPEKVTSGWSKQMGYDDWGLDRRGRPFWTAQFCHGGGGATCGNDGWPYVMISGLRKGNVEMIESRYPWRVQKIGMTCDTEGAGQWRGGPGTFVEWVAEGSARHQFVTGNSDGIRTGIFALAGGQEPAQKFNMQYIIRKRTGEKEVTPTKRGPFSVEEGDRLVVQATGGAGWGDPMKRDPQMVLKDVINGLVSAQRAREVYGVAVSPERKMIDEEETRRLRSS